METNVETLKCIIEFDSNIEENKNSLAIFFSKPAYSHTQMEKIKYEITISLFYKIFEYKLLTAF